MLGGSASGADFQIGERKLTVPDGFEVELVAASPLVERPMHADFDDRGRLYVADSSGSNEKVEKQLAEKPHRIVRLQDTDGDGRFDKSVVFADKMMLPHGAMWHDGSLFVAAPPSIWKLTDTNDDGVADKREEWFAGKTLTGCANDLHGPFLGPDGWIYWCKGAFAQQTYERPGKPPLVTRASHIFRARPDGSRIEPVMTGGMDNPVEVAFTPDGERIVSATFFQHPAAGQRDGLIHAIYGGLYGKSNDVLDGHVRTSTELMPVMTHLGPAAPAGLMRYRSDAFGPEYRDDLFAALFNLHKVTRHVLDRDGASLKTRDEDFLVGHDTDFHPTDVLEDADGSLLIVDTGGWYKLCCPTSQLHKPDVLGGIYRVRRKDAPRAEDPRGLKQPWPDLPLAQLGDRRPAVRDRAIAYLVRIGEPTVKALAAIVQAHPEEETSRSAVWALSRIDSPAARAAVRTALRDENLAATAAVHVAGLWQDREAAAQLLALLKSENASLKRAAAEALGRLGSGLAAEVTEGLLAAIPSSDRVLAHSITYALIEMGDAERIAPVLHAGTPAARKAAVFALEQIESKHKPKLDDVRPWLFSPEPANRELALWLVPRHPEWMKELGDEVLREASDAKTADEHRVALLALCTVDRAVQSRIARQLGTELSSIPRQLVLRAMARAPLKEMPDEWVLALPRALNGRDDELVVAAIGALPPPKPLAGKVAEPLLTVVGSGDYPHPLRVRALAALPKEVGSLPDPAFEFVREQLSLTATPERRQTAATVLSRAQLRPEQRLSLVEALKDARASELPMLLAAAGRGADEAFGRSVLEVIRELPAARALDPASLKVAFAGFPESIRREGELLAQSALPAEQRARMDELTASLSGGDIRRGQAVFNSTKAACAVCHAIGYLGGNLGPDLTRIGQVRTERDLLEAIVFPSASFVRSYEPAVVATKSGVEHFGIIRKDAPDEVVLATGPGAETRLPRSDVADVRAGGVSLMPPGFDQILTREELADLLAFLKATRW